MFTHSFRIAVVALAAALLARFVYLTYAEIATTLVALLK